MVIFRTIFKLNLLFIALFFFTPYLMFSQESNPQIKDSTQVENIVIKIIDIPEEKERLGQRIIKLKEILKPSTDISKIDSLLVITTIGINNKKDSLYKQLKNITRRELKVKKVFWINYRAQLKDYQELLKSRTDDVTEINEEVVNEILKWEKTKEKLASNGNTNDLFKGVDNVLETLQNVLKVIHTRLDKIFIVQNGLSKAVLSIDETISEIELTKLQLQKDYFDFNSTPIWVLAKIDTTKFNSAQINENLTNKRLATKTIKKEKEQLKSFILLNKIPFIFQLFFVISLFILMKLVSKNWKGKTNNLTNPIEIQSKIILSNPITASIVAGVLISSFFYEALIPVLGEIHILFILLGTFFLLPKLTNNRFRVFLSLLILAYLIHTMKAFFVLNEYTERWILITNAVILIIAFLWGIKVIKKSPGQFKPIYRLFKIVTPIYLLFLVISIIINVIGMTTLSDHLLTGVLYSTVLGIVINLTVKVIASLTIILFKLNKTSNIEALTNMVNATHKRTQPILEWIGFFVWSMFTIKMFDLFLFLSSQINNLMNTKWEIGETIISLGGILSFIGIFTITILIAKLIATILQDDWMINVLPRGLASATSLLLRIIIVTLGLYIAASAAGIDLSKLGFILGALGVGIGFGLQTIVLNFISGLILAFERPINLGDTIEVDNEFGVVTNIGVRSSTIKSYSGYESIIPNGDLISKKVNNYTLANRDRRTKLILKTAPSAEPLQVIDLFNKVASKHPLIFKDPTPATYFNGYDIDGSLDFNLLYWTTFSDNLKTNSDISLEIFKALKEADIHAPAPIRRIVKE